MAFFHSRIGFLIDGRLNIYHRIDDGTEISELVYTISLLKRTQKYIPAPSYHPPTELKQLSLLYGIALLMVMGDKSDVVAVTCRQTAANLTIYYSANRPNPRRQDHIEEIMNTIRDIAPHQNVQTPVMDILLSCLEACSRKIKQRIRKLWKASTDLIHGDLLQENLEAFVQSICRPGANYSHVLLFSNFSTKPPVIYLGLCRLQTSW